MKLHSQVLSAHFMEDQHLEKGFWEPNLYHFFTHTASMPIAVYVGKQYQDFQV